MVFAFLSGLFDWLKELKDLFTLHKLADKTVMIIKTDDITSHRRDVDWHGAAEGGSGVNGLL